MEKPSDYYCQYFIYHLDCLSVSFQRLQSNMSSFNEVNESHQNGFVSKIINNKENDADEIPCNEEERLLSNQDIGHDHMPLWKAAVNFICDVRRNRSFGPAVCSIAWRRRYIDSISYRFGHLLLHWYHHGAMSLWRKLNVRRTESTTAFQHRGARRSLLAWVWEKGCSRPAKHGATYALFFVSCPLWFISRLRFPIPSSHQNCLRLS